MTNTPIVLVPGFWLGAWAWDEVAAALRADGHDVTALTLPGLESVDTDRSSITLSPTTSTRSATRSEAAGRPVVLAVHSGSGTPGYARDRPRPGADRGDGLRRHRPRQGRARSRTSTAPELPLPSPEELAEEENLDGLTEEQLETFRQRAVPEPGGVVREAAELTQRRPPRRAEHASSARGSRRSRYKDAVKEGYAWLAGLTELRDVTGSTCRRATGRCGRARRSSPRSSATSRTRRRPERSLT